MKNIEPDTLWEMLRKIREDIEKIKNKYDKDFINKVDKEEFTMRYKIKGIIMMNDKDERRLLYEQLKEEFKDEKN